MKLRFIINPCSGSGKHGPASHTAITHFIAKHSLEAEIVFTRAAGHAIQLAKEARDLQCTHVVCIGGDGTVNEVAQALVRTSIVLVLAPNGSGNGLARHLGLPRSLADTLALLLPGAGRVEEIDTGTVNGRLFCNVMGLGFDADISARFNRMKRRGLVGYLRVGLRAFFERKTELCRIESATNAKIQEALIVAVANSEQYGNDARIAPRASVTDGKLDMVVLSSVSIWRTPQLAAQLFRGKIDTNPAVTRFEGTRFRIHRAAAGIIHTDGEVHHEGADLEVVVQPGSLRVLLPGAPQQAEECSSPSHRSRALALTS